MTCKNKEKCFHRSFAKYVSFQITPKFSHESINTYINVFVCEVCETDVFLLRRIFDSLFHSPLSLLSAAAGLHEIMTSKINAKTVFMVEGDGNVAVKKACCFLGMLELIAYERVFSL